MRLLVLMWMCCGLVAAIESLPAWPKLFRSAGITVPRRFGSAFGKVKSWFRHRFARQSPRFDGWCVRTVDHERNTSIIVILGNFVNFVAGEMVPIGEQFVYLCAQRGAMAVVKEAFLQQPRRTPVSDLGKALWNFTDGSNYAVMNMDGSRGSLRVGIDGVQLNLECSHLVPWSTSDRFDGPEGWLGRWFGNLGILPCRYHVHCTGCQCKYSVLAGEDMAINDFASHGEHGSLLLNRRLSRLIVYEENDKQFQKWEGYGTTHVETNWGSTFPEGWVWAQASNQDATTSISIVAGKFVIGGIKSMQFIIFVRVAGCTQPIVFRTIDLSTFQYSFDGRLGRVQINATTISGDELSIAIDRGEHCIHQSEQTPILSGFGSPLYSPSVRGFSKRPGCRECYDATLTGHLKSLDDFDLSLSLAALEFGGNFQNSTITSLDSC
jgi:hypothetical protein